MMLEKQSISVSKISFKDGAVAALKNAWRPRPLLKPQIDSNLDAMPAIARAIEVIRYSIFFAEYTISPNGGIRAWICVNLLLALVLLVPALLIFPVFGWLIAIFTGWTVAFVQISYNLLLGFLLVAASIMVLMVTDFGVRKYLKLRREKREFKNRINR